MVCDLIERIPGLVGRTRDNHVAGIDLLIVGATALIFDEVVAYRQRKDRSVGGRAGPDRLQPGP